jgi:hypothetical protein
MCSTALATAVLHSKEREMKQEALNKRQVEETWLHTNKALRESIGYRNHLKRNNSGNIAKQYCDAFTLIREAESLLANALTTIEDMELRKAA